MDRHTLAEQLGSLTPAKRALLEQRLKGKGLDSLGSQSIPPRATAQSATLSYSQQRLWFLDQYEPNSSVYNVASAVRLKGGLDIGALERSLNEIVRRHESLRTTFSVVEGEPVQVIAPSVKHALEVVDLRQGLQSEREDQGQRVCEQEARRSFDLARGPLFRSVLIRLGEVDHILLMTLHHIISDGWSMAVLYRELSVLYRAFASGQPSPLADLPIQYADFAIWQREWLRGEVLDSQLSFWKKQLEGAPAVLNLPTDHPRPAVQSYRGSRRSIALSKELTQELIALSRKEGVTVFMALLAAFQTLLFRHTGQDDIVVGTPIANRNRAEIEGLIGFFVNTLVLRTSFKDNPTFKALLARVRELALEAYAHQDLPFEKLVEELKPERNLSHSPLVQVMFVLQNAPSTAMKLEGLSVSPVQIGAETAKFDLTLSMSETVEGLRGSLWYNTALFDDATIARMSGHLETLLEGIVRNPDRRISQLPMLTPAEEHQLLTEWNDTRREYPKDKCIHQLFEEQVERSPDAVAVRFEDQQLTYRELNARANQLARYLITQGVGPEVLVALCMERSLEIVVGILAILKAGGAYVPLDPVNPKERLAFMLEDAKPAVLVTQQRLLENFPHSHTRIVCLDRDWGQIAKEKTENTESKTTSDSMAYAIYTSGTTGQPKGVMISHHNIGRLFRATESWFHFSKNDVWTMFHSYAFDFSVWEIWGALLYGGRVVVVPFWVTRSPEKFYELLWREQVTVLNQTPSAFRQLIQADRSIGNRSDLVLRLIIFGGEALDFQSLQPWLGRHGDQYPQLINMYGITETTVHVTYRVVRSTDVKQGAGSLIGVPLSDLSLYVLDKNRQLVPVGVPGELYVGGAGVGLGYLNRPELTDERFVLNPFNGSKTGKLYKTGDLVRRLSNGELEYLGRTDAQVKIRGFRIELEEIESVLGRHPSVREVVVQALEDGDASAVLRTGKQLVAYVVPKQESVPAINELRSYLKEKLPEYMIPSAFVLLDTVPLTSNGKVDRKALPAPEQNRRDPEESYVAPRTPVEEMLAEIWAELLKLETIGIYDNFFDLGGHSLLATQVNSRIRETLQAELPLRAQFESPTIAELAERVDIIRRSAHALQTLPMLPVSRAGDLPLSFSQERLWFLDQLEPGSSVYNMSGAYRLSGRLDITALERSLNEIVRRHEALRTTFSSVDGVPRQVIATQTILSLPVIDVSADSPSTREEQARRCSTQFARRPFDLSQGPLIRAALVRLSEEEHILLLGMHHIVSDGWSMAIFFRELSALYEAYTNGKASPLAELPIQYADYAVWQRNWLKGEVLETQLSYWKKQLANISPLNLATDRPRPAVQTFHGSRESLLLSKDLTQALKDISRKQGASLFMTLLAALQILLHRLTGQDDIAVGSPIAARNRAEIEGLIGFFLNTLVLRTNLSGDPTFLQLLDQVRGICLEAYAHQDLPFERLLEELRPERDRSRTPLFQVFFNMVNVAERVRPAGLKIEPVSHAEVESKFDLTIYVREHNGALQLNWIYNADLFDRERIREILGQYEKLLTQIAEQPANCVHDYSLLTSTARELLPNPVEPLASDWVGSVHDKLSHYARSIPDHVAITDPNGSWTYAELNARSNKLAHYLLESGIQREEFVAVYAHRSASLPWALLGILKAGAAFLILDPAYPTARLIQYVRSAQPRGFISLDAAGTVPADLVRALEDTIRCQITLPRMSAGAGTVFENYSPADPEIEIKPDDLAYVSYTSGSTGEPKGVQGRHGPLSHFLPWQAAHFGLTCADRFSLLSGLSHDPLHREILTALWVGATLCIPDADLLGTSGELPAWMAQQGITFAHLTPALGRLLAESANPECKIPSLRYAFFIGDKLMRRDIARVRRLAPQVTNVNYYGSTETQRAVSYYELPRQAEVEPRGSIVPVGRGMPGAQLLVLTRARNLAGIGEVGEICLRSPHLARGYLGDPSLTQARFVTNPFTGQLQDRMYQTGDLGRYLRDGSVEVLGRTDAQINIRGFRIEMGDIEFALSQFPAVEDVAVIAREDGDGDKKLIAYIVAPQVPEPSTIELRSFLKQRLPEHMVPSVFVSLTALPLTPNGKVDRRALPVPDYTRQEREAAPVAPRDGLEQQLRHIWEKVLRVRPIGIRDNFFDLGGHSLLAVRLFAQIEKVMGKSLPVAALFHAPTIEQLAQLMSQQEGSDQWRSLVAIQPGGSRPPLFCVHAHDGGVLFWRDLANHLGSDQPFYALQPCGLDGRQPLHTRIEEMAAHYIQEIRTLQPEGPYYISGHCIGGLIAFEMAQQLHLQGERVALLALVDSFAPRGEGSMRSTLYRRYRYRAIRLFERTVSLHIGNLAVLKPRERILYVKGKIDKALYKLYMGLGSRWLSAARTRRNVLKAGSQASRAYRPQVYPGKITVFRATELGGGIEHDLHMGWGRLAGGGLETRLIPGYHAHIVLEPRVRHLAKDLSYSLSRAQEAIDRGEETATGELPMMINGAISGC